jgi:hypothetical protein
MEEELRTKQTEGGREEVPTQLEVLRGVLTLATQYDVWYTLAELANKTISRGQHFGPVASLAQAGARCASR